MPAISVRIIPTTTDHICLQSRKFLKHLAWDRLESKSFLKNSRLQAYMVPIKTEIAGIFGPKRDHNCTHNWSLLQPKLQP